MDTQALATIDTDKISDADFDYLTDAALELVFDTLDLTEADEKTVERIRQRLDTDKYDLSFEMNTPSDGWWEDNVLPDLLSEDEASAQHSITLELNLISTTISGSRAGERVIVASVYVNVDHSLENLQESGIRHPVIKWLPELDG